MVMMGGRVGGGSTAPGFAPTARYPGFTPAAFAGECFYEFYLAVDEGAEGGAAGADHADGEFELAMLFVSGCRFDCGRGRNYLRPDDYVPESVGDIIVVGAMVKPVNEDF